MTQLHGPLSLALDESSPAARAAFSHDAEPDGDGGTGIVLVHGFTGSPAALALWARVCADAGMTVRLPLLPGHGTRPEDLARTPRAQWTDAVRSAVEEVRGTCSRVVVAGLSMGGALSLIEAARGRVDGAILVNPGLRVDHPASALAPVLRYVRPFLTSIGNDIARPGRDEGAYSRTPVAAVAQVRGLFAEARRTLPEIEVPVLGFFSATDHVVGPASRRALEQGLQPGLLRAVPLERSFHVATMDHDADRIFEESLKFIRGLGRR